MVDLGCVDGWLYCFPRSGGCSFVLYSACVLGNVQYPWYESCSLGVLGDYNPYPLHRAYTGIFFIGDLRTPVVLPIYDSSKLLREQHVHQLQLDWWTRRCATLVSTTSWERKWWLKLATIGNDFQVVLSIFHVFYVSPYPGGNDPIWLIFFKWVETTN